jgi:hypothetical protein
MATMRAFNVFLFVVRDDNRGGNEKFSGRTMEVSEYWGVTGDRVHFWRDF